MSVLPVPTDDELTNEARAVATAHAADRGTPLTGTERALLGHLPSFTVYAGLGAIRDALAPIIGERAVTLFSYAIADASGATAAAAPLREAIEKAGENPDSPSVTEAEGLLIEWARLIATDPQHVPAEISARVERTFNPRSRLVLLAFAGQLMATNLVTAAGGIDS